MENEMASLEEQKAEISVELGIRYFKEDNFDLAIEMFTQAIQLNPNNDGAYFYRGVCYEEQKDYELALKDCEKVLELYEEHENDGYHRCDGEYQEYFEKCQELCYLICSIYIEKKKYDDAIYNIQKISQFSNSREKR